MKRKEKLDEGDDEDKGKKTDEGSFYEEIKRKTPLFSLSLLRLRPSNPSSDRAVHPAHPVPSPLGLVGPGAGRLGVRGASVSLGEHLCQQRLLLDVASLRFFLGVLVPSLDGVRDDGRERRPRRRGRGIGTGGRRLCRRCCCCCCRRCCCCCCSIAAASGGGDSGNVPVSVGPQRRRRAV